LRALRDSKQRSVQPGCVPGSGSNRGVLIKERKPHSGGPGKPGPLFHAFGCIFRTSTHCGNVCRTLVTGTAGNPNRLYKHHIFLDVCLLWVQHIEPICNSIQPRFQKTPIKPGKTRKFALTSAFWGLRYALDTKIHSNAVLSLCFGEFSPKSALWAAATNRGSRASFCGKGLKLWPTRGK